jgi:hypothetical protein
MPSLDKDFLELLGLYEQYTHFVETGTWRGETVMGLEPYFNKLYTIEVVKDLYEAAKQKYKGDKIEFLLGDSAVVLRSLVKSIDGSAIFFLDGHWSCGDTGRGEKDVPLHEELVSIVRDFPHKALIIVDDCRLFGKGPASKDEIVDWSQVTSASLLKIAEPRLEEAYFLDSPIAKKDRLIIKLREKLF